MKRILSFLMTFVLCVNLGICAKAESDLTGDITSYYNPAYEEYMESIEGLPKDEYMEKVWNAPPKYSYNEEYISNDNVVSGRAVYASGSSSYDSLTGLSMSLENIDAYTNSNVIGWSFAASDALEIYLRKKQGVDKEACNFSALRLMSEISSTKVTGEYAMTSQEYSGGTFDMAAAYWTRNEHTLENKNCKVLDTVSLSPLSDLSDNEKEKRIESIKKMVRDYGGVFMKYDLFTGAFDQYYSSYNNNNWGEIQSGREIESGVVIVGWDDSYEISKFGASKPSTPGAFKVLTNRVVESSQGTISLGTYYISYNMVPYFQDISAVKRAFPGKYSKYTYEYDKKAHMGVGYSNTATNVYANKYINSTGERQKIKSITTYCEVPNSVFNVYISKSGNMADLQRVSIDYESANGYTVPNMGYVTMELSDELVFDGDFVVAVEVKTPMSGAESIPQEIKPIVNSSVSGRCFVSSGIDNMKKGNYVDQGSKNNIIKVHTINTTRQWYFGDPEFSAYITTGINKTTKFKYGLTLSNGITFRNKEKDVKGKIYKGNLDINKKSVDSEKNYISIELDGPSNVYFIAQTNQMDQMRRLSVYNDVLDNTSYLNVNESKGYCYRYRGMGGCNIKIKAEDNAIRIYGIMVENYDDEKYGDIEDYSSRLWDFRDMTQNMVMTSETDLGDGLRIMATPEKPVNHTTNSVTNENGYKFESAVDLQGVGTDEYRSIAVDVVYNSNIYISARNLSTSERELIITDKYGCDLETKDNLQGVTVVGDCNTYKFTYLGESDTIYIRSLSGAIRIYQIAVTSYSDYVVDDIKCRFDNVDEFAPGQNIDGSSIGNLSFEGGTMAISVCESTDPNFTKAVKIYGNNFTKAGKLKMKISSSTGTSNSKPARKIRIKAKANNNTGKLVLSNQYGYVFGSYNLSTSTNEYVIDYNGECETMYLYITAGIAEIYSVTTNDINYVAAPVSYNLNVQSGQTYRYVFNVENIPASDIYTYTIEYDPTKLKFVHIGKNNNFTGGISDSSISNVWVSNGKITFNIIDPKEENWSGIATVVLFEGIENGSCTIKFSANKRTGW